MGRECYDEFGSFLCFVLQGCMLSLVAFVHFFFPSLFFNLTLLSGSQVNSCLLAMVLYLAGSKARIIPTRASASLPEPFRCRC